MGDEDGIGAGARRGAKQLGKGFRAAAVHLGRLRRPGIGQVRRLRDVVEPGQGGGFVGAVELAGVDVTDRRADLPQRFAERPCRRLALVAQIALSAEIVEIDRLGVDLVGTGGAMAQHDHQPAAAQGLRQFLVVRRRERVGGEQGAEPAGQRQGRNRPPRNVRHRAGPHIKNTPLPVVWVSKSL